MIIDGREVWLGGSPAKIRVNPITVDPTSTWVCVAPMTASAMYRARTTDPLDETLGDADLAARVERCGDRSTSDVQTVDNGGNV